MAGEAVIFGDFVVSWLVKPSFLMDFEVFWPAKPSLFMDFVVLPLRYRACVDFDSRGTDPGAKEGDFVLAF